MKLKQNINFILFVRMVEKILNLVIKYYFVLCVINIVKVRVIKKELYVIQADLVLKQFSLLLIKMEELYMVMILLYLKHMIIVIVVNNQMGKLVVFQKLIHKINYLELYY